MFSGCPDTRILMNKFVPIFNYITAVVFFITAIIDSNRTPYIALGAVFLCLGAINTHRLNKKDDSESESDNSDNDSNAS